MSFSDKRWWSYGTRVFVGLVYQSRSFSGAPEAGEKDNRPYVATGDRIITRCSYQSKDRANTTGCVRFRFRVLSLRQMRTDCAIYLV
jgi:hypothetical protein